MTSAASDGLKGSRASHEKAGFGHSLGQLESITLWQAVGLFTFSTWALGGQIAWARTVIGIWGCLGFGITVLAWKNWSKLRPYAPAWAFAALYALLAYDLFVLVSALNPSHVLKSYEGEFLLIPFKPITWLPSAARPSFSLRELWIRNALFITAFNVSVCLRHRKSIRILLFALTINAFALSVFGTLQKFIHAGLWFGLVKSPNESFFATYIYHNHWGAMIVLSLACCGGLLFHFTKGITRHDFLRSPAVTGLVITFFIAVTLPLSGSRACSVLGLVLFLIATIYFVAKQRTSGPPQKRSLRPNLISAFFCLALVIGGVYFFAKREIHQRIDKTKEQLSELRGTQSLGARSQLYRDTLKMISDKPWTGWGLECYGTIFRLYNRQIPRDNLEIYYERAHSDWLQSLAETGVVGTLLITAAGVLPLINTPWKHLMRTPIACFPLLGCGLICLYACIEFPFACAAVALLFWICFFSAIKYAHLDAIAEK